MDCARARNLMSFVGFGVVVITRLRVVRSEAQCRTRLAPSQLVGIRPGWRVSSHQMLHVLRAAETAPALRPRTEARWQPLGHTKPAFRLLV
jgi:hypothetical protein